MKPQEKSLSDKPLGYLLAIFGGTAGFPLGWIVSPLVLLILNRYMKTKDGLPPKRFRIWALIGCIYVPANIGFTIFVVAPFTQKLIETDIQDCNRGTLEACKDLLRFPEAHPRVTNPAFAQLKKNEELLLEQKRKREDQILMQRKESEKENAIKKEREERLKAERKKEQENAVILARIQNRFAKEKADKARIMAKKQQEYNRKFATWTESSDPWWGCLWALKNQLRDPDSYKDESVRPEPIIKGSSVSYVWRFRSKNGFGGYEIAVAACETKPDPTKISGDWGGYGLPKISILQDQ